MPITPAIHPGKVDWSGENPGILLKEDPDGPFSAMALFFRIAYSPAGRGQALLLYENPNVSEGLPSVRNVMISDNEALARYLVDSFIGKLAAFSQAPAFSKLQYLPLKEVRTEGDHQSRYAEIVDTSDFTVSLVWEELGTPVALELPPELTGPKDREMFTLLVESRKAAILIDDVPLPGQPAPRGPGRHRDHHGLPLLRGDLDLASETLTSADNAALDQVLAVAPQWRSLLPAREAVALPSGTLLHAGPRFESRDQITRPILNSACVAAVFEGLAEDFQSAASQIQDGEIALMPAQDFAVVTPLAAVVSASMLLHEICDSHAPSHRTFAPINGGNGPAMRLGLCNEDVLAHVRWLNGPLAEALDSARTGDVDLISLAAHGLTEGDDCHGRTIAATAELARRLSPGLAQWPEARAFLDQGPSFFLNLWMAACKCMVSAASGVAGSSLVTAAGGNGAAMGLQISGRPGEWFTAPADSPVGDTGDYPAKRALGAIGDSAIVDALGFGAMAMSYAPLQREALGAFLPADGHALPSVLLEREHGGFGTLKPPIGLCARRVIASGRLPVISLGILDKEGTAGRLGGGIYEVPLAPFEAAVESLGLTD